MLRNGSYIKLNDFFRNILMGIALAAPIGPASIAIIQGGLHGGFPRAFKTGLGITGADITYLMLVYFGFARWINIPIVKGLILCTGTVILFYLGVQSIRNRNKKIDFNGTSIRKTGPAFLVGYLVNISNPLAVVFWLGIFGSLISTTADQASSLMALIRGAAIILGILSWHTSMAVLTHWGKRFLNERYTQIISIAAGMVLIAFGARFAVFAFETLFT